MSFVSQLGNDGEISGFLDVKSELTREKGLFKAMKSPWKHRYCIAFRMVEVGPTGRKTTIRLDTYPDKTSFSRSRGGDCQSYGLTDGQIVRVVRCPSRSRPYAFSIFKTEEDDGECGYQDVRAMLQLAGDSESDSQAWIRFIRDCLWPTGRVQLEGVHDLTIIDNISSREARITGNIYLELQSRGLLLLQQEDATALAEWPLAIVKKAELVASDIPQDENKVLSIILNPGGSRYPDEEFRFFARKPLKDLELKLLRALLSLQEQQTSKKIAANTAQMLYRSSKSHATSGYTQGLPQNLRRLSVSSIFSEESRQRLSDEVFDESLEEEDAFTDPYPLKTRANNYSCPEKNKLRPLSGTLEDAARRGSTDDTQHEINRRKSLLRQTLERSTEVIPGSSPNDEQRAETRTESVDSGAAVSPPQRRLRSVHLKRNSGRRSNTGDSGTLSMNSDEVDVGVDSRYGSPEPPNTVTHDSNTPRSKHREITTETNDLATFEEDGEVYHKPKEEGQRKDLSKYLGMNDGSKPKVPPKGVLKSPVRLPKKVVKTDFGLLEKERANRNLNHELQTQLELHPNLGQPITVSSNERWPTLEKEILTESAYFSLDSEELVPSEAARRRASSRSLQEQGDSSPPSTILPTYDLPTKNHRNRRWSQPPMIVSPQPSSEMELLYDHVPSAGIDDELAIIAKQRSFLMNELRLHGFQDVGLREHGAFSVLPNGPLDPTHHYESPRSLMPNHYDVPRGCDKTKCPACHPSENSPTIEEINLPSLPPKETRKPSAPTLPRKQRKEMIICV